MPLTICDLFNVPLHSLCWCLVELFASVFIKNAVLQFSFLWCPYLFVVMRVHFQKVIQNIGMQSSTSHYFFFFLICILCRYRTASSNCYWGSVPSPVPAGSQMSLGSQATRPGSTHGCHRGVYSALLLIWGTASSWAYPLLSPVTWTVKVLHM